MGRGDVKTTKGKIFRSSFGNKRQRKTNRPIKTQGLLPKQKSVKPKQTEEASGKIEPNTALEPITDTKDVEVEKNDKTERKESDRKSDESKKIKTNGETKKPTEEEGK